MPANSARAKTSTLIGEILVVIGPVGLLGLWLYQQIEIEQRSSELRSLATARTVFQTYQSHNAVFNAINEALGKEGKGSENLRTFQIYNYELDSRQSKKC